MANERSEMLEKSTTLYFGPWYRQSPFFRSTLAAGCSSYDIYNHMYLPAYYDDPDTEYWALVEGVTMWDVGVERTVEVSGPDADRLIDFITCRDLTKCAIGQGKYMPVIAPDGGIVNDPVLLHVAENRWWMQLADSDAGLYAAGVAGAGGFDAQVTYPDVHPMQVQGPLSGKTLEKLVGPSIYDLKYYWLGHFTIRDIPVVISRTGWTAVPGFEVNLLDGTRGAELWNAVHAAGEEFEIRPIAPCEARRIEAGIFNYGSDITLADRAFGQVTTRDEVDQPVGVGTRNLHSPLDPDVPHGDAFHQSPVLGIGVVVIGGQVHVVVDVVGRTTGRQGRSKEGRLAVPRTKIEGGALLEHLGSFVGHAASSRVY